MKTIRINSVVVTLLCVLMVAGFSACTTDTVEMNGGVLPDKDPLENTYGMLRSGNSSENTIDVLLTGGGSGSTAKNFYFQQTKPAAAAFSLDARIDESLIDAYNTATEIERTLLPQANYEFLDGQKIDLSADDQRSALKRLRFKAEGLEAGEYVLPLTVAAKDTPDEKKTLYFNVTIREPQLGDYELYQGDDMFFVFYVNTNQYQPLLPDDYFMQKKLARGATVKWYNVVGNIINLRTVRLDYEAETRRAKLNLGADMRYVLDHYVKYNSPLQDKGRKLCLAIEGGGKGVGFCNLTDVQIADFTAQVKSVIEEYGLDGVNLWDRNAGYGQAGMPAMNTTSYPKLIKALREALGAEKLLTVTVYDKPTETFYDTAASGGIAVGDYIDYAWSGYNDNQMAVQLLDPWHPELNYVSDYTQKPIANLPAERFGCVNFPIYPGTSDPIEISYREPEFLVEWIQNGYKPNKIIVFDDLRTNLQDSYETYWNQTFEICCTYLDDESNYILGSRKGYSYTLDITSLGDIGTGGAIYGGYGKWLKDW